MDHARLHMCQSRHHATTVRALASTFDRERGAAGSMLRGLARPGIATVPQLGRSTSRVRMSSSTARSGALEAGMSRSSGCGCAQSTERMERATCGPAESGGGAGSLAARWPWGRVGRAVGEGAAGSAPGAEDTAASAAHLGVRVGARGGQGGPCPRGYAVYQMV